VKQADDVMSETAMTDVATEENSTGAGLGEKLRIARERRALSLEQVSDALHLDEAVIIALEQGRFETLGAPVYVRGHLKAYTQLLGLATDEFLSSFSGSEPETVVAPALRRQGVTPATINPILLAGGGLVVLLGLLLGMYVLFGTEDPDISVADEAEFSAPIADPSVDAVPTGVDTVKAVSEASMPEERRIVALPEVVAEPPEPAIEVDDAVLPTEATTSRPVATMRLALQFRQESWVEISDANRRLLFGLQREGYRREITGEPPFNLLIGNANGVTLTVDGEPFDVPVSGLRGKVARFEITGEKPE
jgi:cytoskeleton protein RodZ